MMKTLKDIGLRGSYTGKGASLLNEFLLPALGSAVHYDRITSFYTIDSLLAISQGIQSLYERGGKMNLILGVHSLPAELVDAELRRDYLKTQVSQIRQEILEGLALIPDVLEKKRVAALAWMIEDGLLSVKAAAVEGEGIFHPKTLIIDDGEGNTVAAIGSSNETGSGLGGNFERFVVLKSWESSDSVADQRRFFASLWENQCEGAIVMDISDDLAGVINEGVGSAYRKPKLGGSVRDANGGVIATAAKMPSNYFVSGEIPALFQHQERAVIDALSRWPVRVLLSDEVGLGKTFEAAATMAFLIKYCDVGRVLILTPKAVLQQWQDELSEHFGINAWLYDSSSRAYVDASGKTVLMGRSNPIGKGSPQIMLMSAQYARGSAGKKTIFERPGAILPDLLVVDEAHSARVSRDISGKKKSTRMYQMLEVASKKIPHLVLATATPMQRDPSEYHAMLKLIGLPKAWHNERSYTTSLSLVLQNDEPEMNDAYTAGKLLRSTMRAMKPSLGQLSGAERSALFGLMEMDDECERFEVASYVAANWSVLRGAFVKLHPAHLLTVRNTRRSLEGVGYAFPQRNLHEEDVAMPDEARLLYMKVNDYIENDCFAVERALDPGRKINVGFVRVSYQQRVASSLHSCKSSLERRLAKILDLKSKLELSGRISKIDLGSIASWMPTDEIDDDELLNSGDEAAEEFELSDGPITDALVHAIEIESTSLPALISRAGKLIDSAGDGKIARAINLAESHIEKGDRVLVFSRYTDTVNALIDEFVRLHPGNDIVYGVYVGQKSAIFRNGVEIACSKRDIKNQLAEGDLRLMFCSDAASEGLNLQAARVLINVDVPWTPARLEQRIGRVARLGQRARSVDVYNVWYPDSIEAKMYRRINSRLRDANIAVGEFPEVVADSIRNAVLDGSDRDDGLEVLQEIRNSTQHKALSELWSPRESGVTTSRRIRERLMSICDEEYGAVAVSQSGLVKTYNLPDGPIDLSACEGMPESVSMGSRVWQYVDYELGDFGYLADSRGNPCVFVRKNDLSSWIDQEYLVDLLTQSEIPSEAISDRWPKMLPDGFRLALSFGLECEIPETPVFWPPVC